MGKKLDKASVIKPKRKCCKSGPRCRKCPVVCKRLMTQGFLESRGDGRVVVLEVVPKGALKAARARG